MKNSTRLLLTLNFVFLSGLFQAQAQPLLGTLMAIETHVGSNTLRTKLPLKAGPEIENRIEAVNNPVSSTARSLRSSEYTTMALDEIELEQDMEAWMTDLTDKKWSTDNIQEDAIPLENWMVDSANWLNESE